MVRLRTLAAVAILAIDMIAAAFVGLGLARRTPVGHAQFEVQVEEGIDAFDRLPMPWAALLRR